MYLHILKDSLFVYVTSLKLHEICQSILIKIQNKNITQKNINSLVNNLPSLEFMEKLLFEILLIGFLLLSSSIISGLWLVDDIFAQKLSHKTVFSIISWFIFLALIVGHKFLGWRGDRSLITVQIGFIFLLVSYYGSKLVLERIL